MSKVANQASGQNPASAKPSQGQQNPSPNEVIPDDFEETHVENTQKVVDYSEGKKSIYVGSGKSGPVPEKDEEQPARQFS